MYVTTECEGLWVTSNLNADSPTFERVTAYPFIHPMRVFFHPNDPTDMWVTSFGNGLRRGTINIDGLATTSFNKEKQKIPISVFPNPVSDYLTVSLPSNINVALNLLKGNLFDIQGKLVAQFHFNTPTQTIKVEPSWTGTYILSITSKKHKYWSAKDSYQVIKNKYFKYGKSPSDTYFRWGFFHWLININHLLYNI